MTIRDLRPLTEQTPIDIGGSLICGAIFTDATNSPCEYGDGRHQCWEREHCTGLHQCACETVPDYLTLWIEAHEDGTVTLARGYLTVEENGAVVCGCCGVNFNADVDQD